MHYARTYIKQSMRKIEMISFILLYILYFRISRLGNTYIWVRVRVRELVCVREREGGRQRERERQADKQTHGCTDRQIDRETCKDKQTDKETVSERQRQTNGRRDRHAKINKQTERDIQWETDRQIDRQTDKQSKYKKLITWLPTTSMNLNIHSQIDDKTSGAPFTNMA